MGPFKRLTRPRPEPQAESTADLDPRSQAHPMPAEPSQTPVRDGPQAPTAREPVPVMEAPNAPDAPAPTPTSWATRVPDAESPGLLSAPPSHAWTAEEQPYDRLDCPACHVIIRELPEAIATCPACGETIRVVRCPEGVRHLLTAAETEAFDGDWDALHARRRREEAVRRNESALRARRAALASYAELGVRLVELRTAADACEACVAAAGRSYRPRSAPDLPIAGCGNAFCRCVYAPARPSPSRR